MAYPTAFSNAADALVYIRSDSVNLSDFTNEQQQAVNIIMEHLYGRVSTTTMMAWSMSPTITVPSVIRGISGRLAASIALSRLAMADAGEVDPYARLLYNQAINELDGILSGRLVIPELIDAGTVIDNSGHLEDSMYNSDIGDPMFVEYTEY